MATPCVADQEDSRAKFEVFKALSVILTPSASKATVNLEGSLLDTVLEDNLKIFTTFLQQSEFLRKYARSKEIPIRLNEGNHDIRKTYNEVCMYLLLVTKEIILAEKSTAYSGESPRGASGNAPQLPPGSLSLQQEKSLAAALQFVIVLGLCPYLASGVGIPISKRLGPGHILLASAQDFTNELSHRSRIEHVLPVLSLLIDFLKEPVLRDIVASNYLADVLTAFVQVRFCVNSCLRDTRSKSNTEPAPSVAVNVSERSHDTLPNSTQTDLKIGSHSWTLSSVKDFCNKELEWLLKNGNAQEILKPVLMLSGCQKSDGDQSTVKSPLWYRRSLAVILRDLIMVPPNVSLLIAAFLGDGAEDNIIEHHKCRAVAHVICRCPVTPQNVNLFYSSISKQLVQMIESDQKLSPLVLRTVGVAVSELYSQQGELMERLCLRELKSSLHLLADSLLLKKEGETILSESALSNCLEVLHRLYVLGQEPQSAVLETLADVTGILFDILVHSQSGVSSVKAHCKALLQSFLSTTTAAEGSGCLMELLRVPGDSRAQGKAQRIHSGVALVPGPSGGTQAVASRQTKLDPDLWSNVVESVVDIVGGSEAVVAELFLLLLQNLTGIVTEETETIDIVLPSNLVSDGQKREKFYALGHKIILVSLIAALGEKFGSELLQTGQQILLFVKATLERSLKMSQCSLDSATVEFEWETVTMAMGLLSAVLGGALELSSEDKDLLDTLLPLLTSLCQDRRAGPQVTEMADDLRVSVATRGLVKVELSKMKEAGGGDIKESKTATNGPSGVKRKPLIEVLSESEGKQEPPNVPSDGPVKQALEELCDPQVPVRGHGLIALARLVEDRHPDTEGSHSLLLKVFLENLQHSDSYIYLAAVNGLSALSDLCPDDVIARLTSEFRSKCKGHNNDLALKVGEALVKAVKRLGDLTPKYGDSLLPALLCGCRHSDSLVRASSLSGLADTCRLLRFAVGPIVHELMTCCRDVLTSDPHAEPRQAAAMTLTLLLQGLGKEALQTLSEVLTDIYRSLKHAVAHDRDDSVKLHCNLALAELDHIMRDALFAPPERTKKITILGYQ